MKTFILLLLALPFSAHAALVYVNYEGVVRSSNTPDYKVGDVFSESFVIDTALAPLDSFDSPHGGIYDAYGSMVDLDFILGSRDDPDLPGMGDGLFVWDDVISFFHGESALADSYGFFNYYADGTPGEGLFYVSALLPTYFFNDDGIVQSFEVSSPSEEGIYFRMNAFLEGRLSTGWSLLANFATTLFSVTPTPGKFTCSQ